MIVLKCRCLLQTEQHSSMNHHQPDHEVHFQAHSNSEDSEVCCNSEVKYLNQIIKSQSMTNSLIYKIILI